MSRVYLDWNATAPLRPEARAAMIAAMDVVGNPSSVHAEGRAAKGLIETARGQVADTFGATGADIVFTSGATEAASLALSARKEKVQRPNEPRTLLASDIEHDCMEALRTTRGHFMVQSNGKVHLVDQHALDEGLMDWLFGGHIVSLQSANSETGTTQDIEDEFKAIRAFDAEESFLLTDATQSFGKVPIAFNWLNADMAMASAHKIGGPKGVGVLAVRQGVDLSTQNAGSGQEMGRRSGTENVIGIAGFGAAAAAAGRDLAAGVWDGVAELRDRLEDVLLNEASDIIIFGKDVSRLPNTSNFAIPGWKGETQVMQMDLAGYAVSAGSACSSGKVKESRVLRAMGFDSLTASSAIRVSIGPTTTETEVMGFARTWIDHYRRWKQRAA